MPKTELYETLHCYGYHGFGSGFEMATTGPPRRQTALYCSRACPVCDDCWIVHRRRVAVLSPTLTADFNELAKTIKGPALVKAWHARHGLAPPDVLVMTGNLEDGACVAHGVDPKGRGEATLTWPLTSLPSTILHAEGD